MKAKKDLKIVVTLRVKPEMKKRIDKVIQAHPSVDQSDLLRRALEIGLDEMNLVGYDAEAVYRAAIAEAKAKLDADQQDRAKPQQSAQNRKSSRTEIRSRELVKPFNAPRE